MNYDHLIVPGERIGPVVIGGLVQDAVQHLGNPDEVTHAQYPDGSPLVTYRYVDECIGFSWEDKGLDPKISNVYVVCNKWATAGGVKVGIPIRDAAQHLGADGISSWREINLNHEWHGAPRQFTLMMREGMTIMANDRNSAVKNIQVTGLRDEIAMHAYGCP